MIFLFVLAIALAMMFFTMQGPDRSPISYSFFYSQLQAGNIAEVEIEGQQVIGTFKEPPLKEETKPNKEGVIQPPQSDGADKTTAKTKNDQKQHYQEFFSTSFLP